MIVLEHPKSFTRITVTVLKHSQNFKGGRSLVFEILAHSHTFKGDHSEIEGLIHILPTEFTLKVWVYSHAFKFTYLQRRSELP